MILTFLWTDMMVWLLVAVAVLWGWQLSRSKESRRKWHAIFRSRIAMASAIVLTVYLLFALVDSVHFKVTHEGQHTGAYEGEIISLLDMAMMHQKAYSERTYSAPFATEEYAKSIVVDENGVTRQKNLPLKYVSSEDPLKRSLPALGLGLLISLIAIQGQAEQQVIIHLLKVKML